MITSATDYVSDYFVRIEKEEHPSEEWIKTLLQQCQYDMCVIDVGLIDGIGWDIVEVNPPYALSSYDLPIDQYVAFCVKAWNHYKR